MSKSLCAKLTGNKENVLEAVRVLHSADEEVVRELIRGRGDVALHAALESIRFLTQQEVTVGQHLTVAQVEDMANLLDAVIAIKDVIVEKSMLSELDFSRNSFAFTNGVMGLVLKTLLQSPSRVLTSYDGLYFLRSICSVVGDLLLGLWRFTKTSHEKRTCALMFWEPGAAGFALMVDTLKLLKSLADVPTIISILEVCYRLCRMDPSMRRETFEKICNAASVDYSLLSELGRSTKQSEFGVNCFKTSSAICIRYISSVRILGCAKVTVSGQADREGDSRCSLRCIIDDSQTQGRLSLFLNATSLTVTDLQEEPLNVLYTDVKRVGFRDEEGCSFIRVELLPNSPLDRMLEAWISVDESKRQSWVDSLRRAQVTISATSQSVKWAFDVIQRKIKESDIKMYDGDLTRKKLSVSSKAIFVGKTSSLPPPTKAKEESKEQKQQTPPRSVVPQAGLITTSVLKGKTIRELESWSLQNAPKVHTAFFGASSKKRKKRWTKMDLVNALYRGQEQDDDMPNKEEDVVVTPESQKRKAPPEVPASPQPRKKLIRKRATPPSEQSLVFKKTSATMKKMMSLLSKQIETQEDFMQRCEKQFKTNDSRLRKIEEEVRSSNTRAKEVLQVREDMKSLVKETLAEEMHGIIAQIPFETTTAVSGNLQEKKDINVQQKSESQELALQKLRDADSESFELLEIAAESLAVTAQQMQGDWRRSFSRYEHETNVLFKRMESKAKLQRAEKVQRIVATAEKEMKDFEELKKQLETKKRQISSQNAKHQVFLTESKTHFARFQRELNDLEKSVGTLEFAHADETMGRKKSDAKLDSALKEMQKFCESQLRQAKEKKRQTTVQLSKLQSLMANFN